VTTWRALEFLTPSRPGRYLIGRALPWLRFRQPDKGSNSAACRRSAACSGRSARFCCPLLETGGLTESRSSHCAKISPTVIEHPIIEYVLGTTADLLCIHYLAIRRETSCLVRILTLILGRSSIDRAG
jgi:hypothetical protein